MSDIALRHLHKEEMDTITERVQACEGFETWMLAFMSFHVVSYYADMSEMTSITCWHPDSTPFYSSCDPQACVSAFAKYPYEG